MQNHMSSQQLAGQSHTLSNNRESQSMPWNVLLQQIPDDALRTIAASAWNHRKVTRFEHLRRWIAAASKQWRTVPGMQSHHLSDDNGGYMIGPLVHFARLNNEFAAPFMSLWIDGQRALIDKVIAHADGAGAIYIPDRAVLPERVFAGFRPYPADSAVARAIAPMLARQEHAEWSLRLVATWIHSYLQFADALESQPSEVVSKEVSEVIAASTILPSQQATGFVLGDTTVVPNASPVDIVASQPPPVALCESIEGTVAQVHAYNSSLETQKSDLDRAITEGNFARAAQLATVLAASADSVASGLAALASLVAQAQDQLQSRLTASGLSMTAATAILRLLPEDDLLRARQVLALHRALFEPDTATVTEAAPGDDTPMSVVAEGATTTSDAPMGVAQSAPSEPVMDAEILLVGLPEPAVSVLPELVLPEAVAEPPAASVEVAPVVPSAIVEQLSESDRMDVDHAGIEPVEEVTLALATPPVLPTTEGETEALPALPGLPAGRIAPEKRGGRPRGLSNDYAEDEADVDIDRTRPTLRTSVVAYQHELVWRVGVEVAMSDETLLDEVTVLQSGYVLAREQGHADRWRLTSLDPVTVFRGELPIASITVVEDRARPLFFRLSQRDVGRLVTKPSQGVYLILAPATWVQATPSYRAPEPTAWPDYVARFAQFGSNQANVSFQVDEQTVFSETGSAQFVLEGAHLVDANPERPPLYFDYPPQLVAARLDDWAAIGRIVIVEEGEGVLERRRFAFTPSPVLSRQHLTILKDVDGGWFSIRLYDQAGELLDVLSFRYAAGLTSLTLTQTERLPVNGKQPSASVRAVYKNGATIRVDEPEELCDATQRVALGLRTEIPNLSSVDVTDWRVVVADRTVLPVSMRVRRVWWGVSEHAPIADEWVCVPIDLQQDWLRANAGMSLWIKAPPDARVHVGFARTQARALQPDPVTGLAELRLGSLAAEAENRRSPELQLWLGDASIVIGMLLLDPALPAAQTDVSATAVTRSEQRSNNDVLPADARPTREPSLETPLTRVVEERAIDYSHLGDLTGDPDFRWYAISCTANQEANLCRVLGAQVDARHLKADVPIVLYPCRERRIQNGWRNHKELAPLIEHGYIFVYMRSGTHIGHLLESQSATLLKDPIPEEWLEKIIRFKRANTPAGRILDRLPMGATALVTDGPLKGQTGRIRSWSRDFSYAEVEVQLMNRALKVTIAASSLTPA